ncbi:hypothetical protein [Prochlorococcus marinus]|nr:hypothetical protein [Prochlorococcus marinus]
MNLTYIKSFLFLTISDNYSNQPNLLLMVNKSKKIEVNERIKPNIINGLDLMFSSCLGLLFEEDKFLSFFL